MEGMALVLQWIDLPEERLQVLMTLWRSWHVHNEITHDKPAPPIEASTRFLSSYIDTLLCIKQYPTADIDKGKMVVSYHGKQPIHFASSEPHVKSACWSSPPSGWTKLNVDGAFVDELGTGGAGMVLRCDTGHVIYSSCRCLRSCSSALEAELAACMKGLSTARAWSSAPIIIEMDCLVAAQMILQEDTNRSPYAAYVGEIKRMLEEGGEHAISHVVRSRNSVAHALAQMGLVHERTAVWLRSTPGEIVSLCNEECNDPS